MPALVPSLRRANQPRVTPRPRPGASANSMGTVFLGPRGTRPSLEPAARSHRTTCVPISARVPTLVVPGLLGVCSAPLHGMPTGSLCLCLLSTWAALQIVIAQTEITAVEAAYQGEGSSTR